MTKTLIRETSVADAIVQAISRSVATEKTVTLLQESYVNARCVSSNLLNVGNVVFLPVPSKGTSCLEAVNKGGPLFVSRGETLLDGRDVAIVFGQDLCEGMLCAPLQTELTSGGAASSTRIYSLYEENTIGALLIGFDDAAGITEQDIQSSLLIGNLIIDRHRNVLESLLTHAAWSFGIQPPLQIASNKKTEAVMQPNAEQINEDEEEDEEGDEDEEEEVPVLDPTQYELLRSAAKRFMLQFPNRHIECAYQRWRVARLVNMDGPLLFLMIVYYLFRLVGPVSSKLQWEGLTGYAFWKEFLQCCALSMVFIVLTIPISRVFYLRHRELIMIIVNASLVWGCLWSWPGTWISQNMEFFSREWTASANNDSLQSIGDSLLTMIAQTSWIVTLNYVARIQYHVQLSLLGTSLVGVVAESCLTAGGTKLSWSSLPLSILPISMTLLVPCAVSYYLEYKSRELFCSSITAFRLIYHKY